MIMAREMEDRTMGTADLVGNAEQRDEATREVAQQTGTMDEAPVGEAARQDQEQLAALFEADVSQDFRQRWSDVQIGFVDDPQRAVQKADELVAQVMKSLAESFARQRASIEADVGGADQKSTENLRVALRRYRSFFERLLTL
jgi:hypothetical protein